MMKIIYPLIVLFIFGCQTDSNNPSVINDLNTTLPDNNSNNYSLNGVWGLTNYFDSIIHNKELAKYRIQPPTWFGLIFEIDNDSVNSYGSIIDNNFKINLDADTISIIDSYGGKYWLSRKKNHLELIQLPNQSKLDTTKYIYRKRDDLKSIVTNMDKFHKISSNISNYFNNELFSGAYLIKNTNDTVKLFENGELENFKDFKEYTIRNYFGTSHPFNNLDVLILKNNQKTEYWNWVFNKNELKLTRLVSDFKASDDYKLSDETIYFRKIN